MFKDYPPIIMMALNQLYRVSETRSVYPDIHEDVKKFRSYRDDHSQYLETIGRNYDYAVLSKLANHEFAGKVIAVLGGRNGHFGSWLTGVAARVHISDYFQGWKELPNFAVAQEQWKASAIDPSRLTCSVEDITKLSYASETFDFVICTSVIEHMMCQKNGSGDTLGIVEMSRVLKPGGMLLLSTTLGADDADCSPDVRCYSRQMLWDRVVTPSKCQFVGPYNFDFDHVHNDVLKVKSYGRVSPAVFALQKPHILGHSEQKIPVPVIAANLEAIARKRAEKKALAKQRAEHNTKVQQKDQPNGSVNTQKLDQQKVRLAARKRKAEQQPSCEALQTANLEQDVVQSLSVCDNVEQGQVDVSAQFKLASLRPVELKSENGSVQPTSIVSSIDNTKKRKKLDNQNVRIAARKCKTEKQISDVRLGECVLEQEESAKGSAVKKATVEPFVTVPPFKLHSINSEELKRVDAQHKSVVLSAFDLKKRTQLEQQKVRLAARARKVEQQTKDVQHREITRNQVELQKPSVVTEAISKPKKEQAPAALVEKALVRHLDVQPKITSVGAEDLKKKKEQLNTPDLRISSPEVNKEKNDGWPIASQANLQPIRSEKLTKEKEEKPNTLAQSKLESIRCEDLKKSNGDLLEIAAKVGPKLVRSADSAKEENEQLDIRSFSLKKEDEDQLAGPEEFKKEDAHHLAVTEDLQKEKEDQLAVVEEQKKEKEDQLAAVEELKKEDGEHLDVAEELKTENEEQLDVAEELKREKEEHLADTSKSNLAPLRSEDLRKGEEDQLDAAFKVDISEESKPDNIEAQVSQESIRVQAFKKEKVDGTILTSLCAGELKKKADPSKKAQLRIEKKELAKIKKAATAAAKKTKAAIAKTKRADRAALAKAKRVATKKKREVNKLADQKKHLDDETAPVRRSSRRSSK